MTSSNGNIFRVTGHLCGEFTGPGEFPAQRPVTRSFDVFFDISLSKQSRGWWFETQSRPLWRQCNGKTNKHNKLALLHTRPSFHAKYSQFLIYKIYPTSYLVRRGPLQLDCCFSLTRKHIFTIIVGVYEVQMSHNENIFTWRTQAWVRNSTSSPIVMRFRPSNTWPWFLIISQKLRYDKLGNEELYPSSFSICPSTAVVKDLVSEAIEKRVSFVTGSWRSRLAFP